MKDEESAEYSAAEAFVRDRLGGAVGVRLAQGDFAEGLLAHFRTRPHPRLLFSPERVRETARLADLREPEETAWQKEIADQAVAGRLYAASNAHCRRFIDVHQPGFDFSSIDHFDPQAIHGLGRHRWLAELARRYWRHGERPYYDALMREWDFAVERVPFPNESFLGGIHAIGPVGLAPPFGELDIFIRLTNWYWAYWLALFAPHMTPERCVCLLARCLRLFDIVAARGIKTHEHNFTSMQMEALYLWASALPEFTGMTVWKHAARNTMESSLARAVWDDGVQWEKSAGYHLGCIRWYGTSFLLGQRNGEQWAPEYGERLRKMGRFADAIVTPDGNTSLLSDSDRTGAWRSGLSLLRSIFPDATYALPFGPTAFSLWVSDGADWEPGSVQAEPHETVRLFPHGGVGVVKTSARDGAGMLILDNGPTHAGHSHKDNLTVHYEAFGRPVIVDPGRWIYRQDTDRRWVVTPHSHNALVPEDLSKTGREDRDGPPFLPIASTADPRIGPIRMSGGNGFARLDSSFSGFAVDPSATVARTAAVSLDEARPWLVVIDRIAAAAELPWTNSWLLPATEPAEEIDGGYVVRLAQGLSVGITVATPGPVDFEDAAMFWCRNYAEKEPARWLRFCGKGRRMTRVFVFVPTRGAPAPTQVDVEEDEIVVRVGGECYCFCHE